MQNYLLKTNDGLQWGLVGFFDILGFAQVAANENLTQTIRLIEEQLLQAANHAHDEFKRKFNGPNVHGFEVRWLIFADSILAWHPIPQVEYKGADYWLKLYHWHRFFAWSAILMRQMFQKKLPLRGAIAGGEFYIKNHCFAGKPIIDCHELASKTEWAGCVIHPSSAKELKKMLNLPAGHMKQILQQSCMNYKVPLKKEKRSRHLVIKWFHLDRSCMADETPPNISNEIKLCFQGYDRSVRERDRIKIENTKAYLHFADRLYTNSNKKIPKRIWQRLIAQRKFAN